MYKSINKIIMVELFNYILTFIIYIYYNVNDFYIARTTY